MLLSGEKYFPFCLCSLDRGAIVRPSDRLIDPRSEISVWEVLNKALLGLSLYTRTGILTLGMLLRARAKIALPRSQHRSLRKPHPSYYCWPKIHDVPITAIAPAISGRAPRDFQVSRLQLQTLRLCWRRHGVWLADAPCRFLEQHLLTC